MMCEAVMNTAGEGKAGHSCSHEGACECSFGVQKVWYAMVDGIEIQMRLAASNKQFTYSFFSNESKIETANLIRASNH